MKFYFHFKIAILVVSSLVPWPETVNYSPGCSREFSFIVRNFVFKKWTPIFDKYKVEIPLDCPLHPWRDIFDSFHKSKLVVDSRQWSCSLCGKSFHAELFLDLHLLKKHHDKLSLVEDSVCPADFCDLFRCEVLRYTEITKSKNATASDDSDGNKQREQTVTALAKATPQGLNPLSRYNNPVDICLTDDQCKRKGWLVLPSQLHRVQCCSPAKPSAEPAAQQSPIRNQTIIGCNHFNLSDLNSDPAVLSSEEEELSASIKQKQSSCREEDFIVLRSKCARLIHSCTAGLVLRMTNQQFFHFRDELNRSVCWHLQCDRYWQEVWSSEANPSTLFFLAVCFVTAGLASSYLIVCVLCQEPSSVLPSESCSSTIPTQPDTDVSRRTNGYERKPSNKRYSYIPDDPADLIRSDDYYRTAPSRLMDDEFEENSLI